VHAAACSCPSCGGALRRLGEDVTEVLEYRPGRFPVIRHLRPEFSCRRREAITQAVMPDLPIELARPGPGLLAHVPASKDADHQPLYRQSEIYAREGVALERSTLADWVGRSGAILEPLVNLLREGVMAAARLHARACPRAGRRPDPGDTPVPVLGPVIPVACRAHVRRKFHDVYAARQSPVVQEALERIAALYAVEKAIRGRPPDERRQVRQKRSRPVAEDLFAWREITLPKLSGRSGSPHPEQRSTPDACGGPAYDPTAEDDKEILR
jgi:transposase